MPTTSEVRLLLLRGPSIYIFKFRALKWFSKFNSNLLDYDGYFWNESRYSILSLNFEEWNGSRETPFYISLNTKWVNRVINANIIVLKFTKFVLRHYCVRNVHRKWHLLEYIPLVPSTRNKARLNAEQLWKSLCRSLNTF